MKIILIVKGLTKNVKNNTINFVKNLKVTKVNGQINKYTLGISYPITQFDDPNFFEKVFRKLFFLSLSLTYILYHI